VLARPVLVRVRKSTKVNGGRNFLWIDAPSGVLDREFGRCVPGAVSGHMPLLRWEGMTRRDPSLTPNLLTYCRSKCFIPMGGELARTLSLTLVVPRDMTETYGGRAVAAAWGGSMGQAASCSDTSTSDSRSDARLGPLGLRGFLRSVAMVVHLARAWMSRTDPFGTLSLTNQATHLPRKLMEEEENEDM
ncbi:hypothetical protein BHM03_00031581, partial [Ensete ventricosum]